ncbi:MAG: ferredoxin family protein [Lachnospiraceae bacterium]|jgi:NAD-dependent dihydropyrimidine dehydrogenase PreA subunit|nr:ferredoxin family protein [Lachnospiraceae bacterium]
MSVRRIDITKCIGCENCWNICPMDVFRFDYIKKKSIIAYPENCQSCGQCYLHCLGHSLGFSDESTSYAITSTR